MIQAPGLNPVGTGPHWLGEMQIAYEFHLSEKQIEEECSLMWKQRAITFLKGKARGEEQRARRERNKK
jgi:hypothetical protein